MRNGHWKQLFHASGGKTVITRDIPATFPVGGEYPTNRNFNIAFINTFSEGSQTVIIEAMACGIPVIASEVGGVDELVTPKTGILVNPGNPKLQHEALLQAKARNWNRNAIRQELENNYESEKWTEVILHLICSFRGWEAVLRI